MLRETTLINAKYLESDPKTLEIKREVLRERKCNWELKIVAPPKVLRHKWVFIPQSIVDTINYKNATEINYKNAIDLCNSSKSTQLSTRSACNPCN